MKTKYFLILIIFLNFFSVIAQENIPKEIKLTHSKLDKLIINELKLDSINWSFSDFKYSIKADSLWQNLLKGQELFKAQEEIYANQSYLENVDYNLPIDTLKKRLKLLDEKTPLHVTYHPDLERTIKYYLKSQKKRTEDLMALSQYYFPMFEGVLDKYNIPLEIKYLAIVESALNPRAKSRVGATGLWQFMFSTGKIYDLDVSSYVDERMSPERSTEAAAKYLTHLYGIFDDWNLALAAYNSGPGNVNKAIRRSGGKRQYWALRPYLPRETSSYVPAFLAMMYLYEYADEHNYQASLPEISFLQTDTVQTKGLVKLEQVAKITNTDLEFLKFLNPSYKLGIIPKEPKKKYSIRLPITSAGLFVANEDKIYDYAIQGIASTKEKLPDYSKIEDKIRYRVRSGDYLGKIANRYGVKVSQIKRWNGLRSNKLNIGDRLTIYPRKPSYTSSPTKTKSNTSTSQASANSSNAKVYVVKSGDSLWTISRKFKGISVRDIKKLNNLSSNALKPGMTLKISS